MIKWIYLYFRGWYYYLWKCGKSKWKNWYKPHLPLFGKKKKQLLNQLNNAIKNLKFNPPSRK